jgi:hypothetical protein
MNSAIATASETSESPENWLLILLRASSSLQKRPRIREARFFATHEVKKKKKKKKNLKKPPKRNKARANSAQTQLHSLFVLWWIGRGQFDLLVGLA